ncbi:uncharacterized protein NPIL_395661 [Nephila pilipes]|uniref:Uncharacterized protein n=1 Tax=Nephila pilipes TaxID=299642 RepID=A0A8X6IRL0_NEPPI|nr:uncharacterized protein NPIL_395661 [Nephila pilipes]
MSIFQKLEKETNRLKIALIEHEKLGKEPVTLDTDILREKIIEQKKLLQKARSEQKLKNIMCINLQFADTLQKIIGVSKANKKNCYPQAQRIRVVEKLKKKKEMKKRLSAKRQEISQTDEQIQKLQEDALDRQKQNHQLRDQINKYLPRLKKHSLSELKKDSQSSDGNSVCDSISKYRHEELNRLNQNNEQLLDRVHLLSDMIQSLANQLEDYQKDDESLSELIIECKNITSCQFNNLDDIDKLLKNICSINHCF